ncbi:hypothetical protein JG688_00014589 [Phytophthora aleatoria]|uniref:RxLR effector protein n=1 Tax=Phytophthora aleatoria TaxID=2496075 RepID=A0A8J5MDW0_9STRA|nr:hypothetical protein JG688_00014589 [Phytophthora aleatoria]
MTRTTKTVMNAAIEKLTGLVKTGAMKINGNVNWRFLLTGEQPADEILKMFKLENGMKRALASPNLKLMKNYVQEVNTSNRNNKLSLIGIFTTHYGDDAVAKALVTMQSKLGWKSVDDVFTLLKFRKNGHLALASPKMEVLDDYMKLVIRTNSGDETLLQTLTKGFGGEEKLATLLVRAKEDPSTKELATALQNALVNKWIQTDKLQPENVFKKFRLDRGVEDALLDPNGHTLAAFISMYNARNPNSQTSLIGMFSARYGDDVVAETLVLARADRAKKPLATNLQQQQFQEWQKSKKSADDVFKLLKIQSQDFVALISPKLETVSEYIKALKATDPGDTSDLLTVVINGVGGDSALARAVASALKELNAHDPLAATLSTAAEYELMLFKRWRKGDINPNSIKSQFRVRDDAFVRRYRAYYDEKKALDNPTVITAINPLG